MVKIDHLIRDFIVCLASGRLALDLGHQIKLIIGEIQMDGWVG